MYWGNNLESNCIQINIALIVANSNYIYKKTLTTPIEDKEMLREILEEHSFEVHEIQDSLNIEKDVMEIVRNLPEEKKKRLDLFHLYYSGNEDIWNYNYRLNSYLLRPW